MWSLPVLANWTGCLFLQNAHGRTQVLHGAVTDKGKGKASMRYELHYIAVETYQKSGLVRSH